MKVPRVSFAAASEGGLIYAIEGFNYDNTGTASLSAEAFNPLRNHWTTLPPLPVHLDVPCAMALGGKVYVTGSQPYKPTQDFLVYSRGAWSIGPSVPGQVVFGACSRGADGMLYGFDGGGSGRVYRYDPSLNAWSTLTSTDPSRASAVAVLGPDNNIYVLESPDSNAVIKFNIYHPATDTWTMGTPFPNGHFYLTGATIGSDGRMYATGGVTAAYSFSSGTWAMVTQPPGKGDGKLAMGDNHLYYFGGYRPGPHTAATAATYEYAP
jgi:hypothetical protein